MAKPITSRREIVDRLVKASQNAVRDEMIRISDEHGYITYSEHVSTGLGILRQILRTAGHHRTINQLQVRTALQNMIFETPFESEVHDAEISPVPMMCEHANEVPRVCPCGAGCYCKTHSCRPLVIPEGEAPPPAPILTGDMSFKFHRGECPRCTTWCGVVTTGSELDRCGLCRGLYIEDLQKAGS